MESAKEKGKTEMSVLRGRGIIRKIEMSSQRGRGIAIRKMS
jgi:hypothetical protein